MTKRDSTDTKKEVYAADHQTYANQIHENIAPHSGADT